MESKFGIDRPQAFYRALQHPFRRELLNYMYELDEPMSAVDFVKGPGVSGRDEEAAISYVSYHLRQLQKADAIKLSSTKAVRGANKYLYRISRSFADAFGDTVALNRIAALLVKEAPEVNAGVLREIGEIVTSTGRSITWNGRGK
jgi:hypothetical protein